MRFFHYLSIVVLIGLAGFFIYQYSPHYQIIKGEVFGTYYNIKIKTDNKNNQLKGLIDKRLEEINVSQSVFKEDSEIMEINRAKAGQKVKLSKDMREVLRAADKVYRQSNGAFDPSLGKLIDMWGFGKSDKITPTDSEIKKALQSVGLDKFKFSNDYQYVVKKNNKAFLNLSGIAKGYGVDEIAALLEKEGYHDFVVEIGGEIKTKGYRGDGSDPWVIGINRPSANSHENIMALSLSNMAVATSGNYRNFYESDGKVFGHTISAKTGYPVETDVLSASVFDTSCMMADAYATAMVVLGVEKGLAFADKYKLKAIIYDTNYQRHTSKAAKDMF